MECIAVNQYCDNPDSFGEVCVRCNRCLRFSNVCRYCKWFDTFMSIENGMCKLNPVEVSKRYSNRCSHFEEKSNNKGD